jgi:hypothetical protein
LHYQGHNKNDRKYCYQDFIFITERLGENKRVNGLDMTFLSQAVDI